MIVLEGRFFGFEEFATYLAVLERHVLQEHGDLEVHTGEHPDHGEVTLIRCPGGNAVFIAEGVRFVSC
jgi:hypothetical protein